MGQHHNSLKTHCPYGHPLDEGNLDPWQLAYGRRCCLTCARKRKQEFNLRKRREAGVQPRPPKGSKTHCPKGHSLGDDNLLGGKKAAQGKKECRTCHRDREMARARARGVKPQEKATVCGSGHDLTNPDNLRPNGKGCKLCHQEDARKRYHRDVEAARAAARAYQETHKEEARERSRRWRAANRERDRATARMQGRARAVGRDKVALAYGEIVRCDPCSYCGGPAGCIDHIDALATGGANSWTNLTGVCVPCNSRKRTRPLLTHLLSF